MPGGQHRGIFLSPATLPRDGEVPSDLRQLKSRGACASPRMFAANTRNLPHCPSPPCPPVAPAGGDDLINSGVRGTKAAQRFPMGFELRSIYKNACICHQGPGVTCCHPRSHGESAATTVPTCLVHGLGRKTLTGLFEFLSSPSASLSSSVRGELMSPQVPISSLAGIAMPAGWLMLLGGESSSWAAPALAGRKLCGVLWC